MKYIDAKRLKCELEKRLKNVRDYMNGAGMKYKGPKYYKAQGKESAYDALLSVIDSLQQEQPDFPTTDEQIKDFLATHPKIKVPEKYKNPDWLLKKQEQPEKKEVKFVFPKFLYARTRDNNTIDVSYAPQDMNAIEYIRKDMVVDAIKLAYGKVSMNPFDHSEAFEELLNKI